MLSAGRGSAGYTARYAPIDLSPLSTLSTGRTAAITSLCDSQRVTPSVCKRSTGRRETAGMSVTCGSRDAGWCLLETAWGEVGRSIGSTVSKSFGKKRWRSRHRFRTAGRNGPEKKDQRPNERFAVREAGHGYTNALCRGGNVLGLRDRRNGRKQRGRCPRAAKRSWPPRPEMRDVSTLGSARTGNRPR